MCGGEKPDCETCKKLKGEAFDIRDCKICLPDCFPENEDAEKIFLAVRDQYIMSGMGGPIAINQVAIHQAMDLYEIEFKQDCFEKVVNVGRKFLNDYNEKQKEKQERK